MKPMNGPAMGYGMGWGEVWNMTSTNNFSKASKPIYTQLTVLTNTDLEYLKNHEERDL